jgi:hypothetical protein
MPPQPAERFCFYAFPTLLRRTSNKQVMGLDPGSNPIAGLSVTTCCNNRNRRKDQMAARPLHQPPNVDRQHLAQYEHHSSNWDNRRRRRH